MPGRWSEIKQEHVIEAIRRYNENPGDFAPPRNTYLVYDGKEYPAKAIRGMAYQVCFGEKVSHDDFNGGEQTARFFDRLGFSVKKDGKKWTRRRNRRSVATSPAGNTFSLLDWRKLEIEVQRIRLNYLKWFFNFASPSDEIIPGLGCGEGYGLIETHNARSFSAFPCGLGSVYVGGGKGSLRMPFEPCSDLDTETQLLKTSIAHLSRSARADMLSLLNGGDVANAWSMLIDYWWIKLGMHEYAHDVTYEIGREDEEINKTDIRDYVVTTMLCGQSGRVFDEARIDSDKLERFIRHRSIWNRWACCSFECGPIVVGKGGFVSYEQIVDARKAYFSGRSVSNANEAEKREMARASLSDTHEFLAVYSEEPLSLMKTYGGFHQHRAELSAMIADVQQKLNAIIERERLDLPVFTYVPE